MTSPEDPPQFVDPEALTCRRILWVDVEVTASRSDLCFRVWFEIRPPAAAAPS